MKRKISKNFGNCMKRMINVLLMSFCCTDRWISQRTFRSDPRRWKGGEGGVSGGATQHIYSHKRVHRCLSKSKQNNTSLLLRRIHISSCSFLYKVAFTVFTTIILRKIIDFFRWISRSFCLYDGLRKRRGFEPCRFLRKEASFFSFSKRPANFTLFLMHCVVK